MSVKTTTPLDLSADDLGLLKAGLSAYITEVKAYKQANYKPGTHEWVASLHVVDEATNLFETLTQAQVNLAATQEV